MIDYQKILADKEYEISKLKAECDALKEAAIVFPGNESVVYSLRDVIAIFPGNIFWRNKNGQMMGLNNNLAQFLGCSSPNEVIGKHNEEFLRKDSAEPISEVDRQIQETGEDFIGTEIGYSANNEVHYFLSHKKAIRNKIGEVVGQLGISLDITEQKQLEHDLQMAKEKAEASNHAKSQFLAVMSHELRTPLACIINLTELLKNEDVSKEESETLIKTIGNCSQYLLSLVNDALDFSKLETGKHHAKHKPIKLDELFADVFDMLTTLATAKDLELVLDFPSDTTNIILSDPQVLRQILINLINNAIKFTESGSVCLEVRQLGIEQDYVKLAFSIIDTGMGIPEDKLHEIFEPFQQLEDAYMRQSSRAGTGLGLAIVERLVRVIGGELQVASAIGEGSVFTVTGSFMLPQAYKEPIQSISDNVLQPPTKLKESNWSKPPHILLIEDDAVLQFVHQKMLSNLGCDVEIAKTGREALEKFAQHDLVFADISLPDVSGFAVIKGIRESAGHGQDVPIVALTVYTDKEEKNACLQAGANYFASKPISTDLLKNLIEEYLPGFKL